MLGVDVSKDEDLKQEIGEALIEKMIERTQFGLSRFGKGFKGYSKSYKKSSGKSNPPDLTVKGKMLGDIDITEDKKNTITIGFNNSKQGAKAHGHIVGARFLPMRDFFGLTAGDIKDVKKEFEASLKPEKKKDKDEDDKAEDNGKS